MPTWILAVIAASIAATAGLAWVLMRINAPPSAVGRPAQGDGGPLIVGGGAHDIDADDDGDGDGDGGDADAGGGDSGGGDGGSA